MNDKLLHIEGIRGIACFMVVLSHLALVFYPGLHEKELISNATEDFIFNSPIPFIYSGTAAVFIFFVLSGYVLTFGVMKRTDILSAISTMTIRRYFRLAPPVLASCILSFVVIRFFDVDTTNLSAWISSYGNFEPTMPGAIYSALIETFFRGGSAYNPVLWTMKIELIGSLIIFFYCAVAAGNENKLPIAIMFSVFVFLLPLSQTEKYSYICFIIGAVMNNLKKTLSLPASIIILFVGIYFGGVHYGSAAYASAIEYVSHPIFGEMTNAYYLFCAVSGVLIVFSVVCNTKQSIFFGKALFVYSGKVSFSVYLIHMPMLYLIAPLVFNSSISMGYFQAAAIASTTTIVCIYVAANYFYKIFDISAISFSKAISKKVAG